MGLCNREDPRRLGLQDGQGELGAADHAMKDRAFATSRGALSRNASGRGMDITTNRE
jgi:hypothetical protein